MQGKALRTDFLPKVISNLSPEEQVEGENKF